MSEKYIDLYPEITHMSLPESDRNGIAMALHWLDEHPDQVPGRTITASERDSRTALLSPTEKFGWIKGFEDAGGRVVPDPEPTNAEKLEKIIWASDGPVASISLTRAEMLAKWLDEAGVKAPGGDEPDAEHNRDWWIENANVNDAEDCEACIDDLCPVHHGIDLGIEFVTKKIAALGDDPELFNSIPNPPKAPGGDDDR